MGTEPDIILETRHLSKSFRGFVAVDDVNLKVQRGHIHALIGPNGAGKSTLIDAITGFVPCDAGQIELQGKAIHRYSAVRRAHGGIRRTFQQSQAVESLTVDEYLRLAGGGSFAGAEDHPETRPNVRVRDADATSRLRAVREWFGLPPGAVPIRLMDVGSRRLLEIAAALVTRPRVLLLDEPASGLDEAESRGLAVRLRAIPELFGAAVLVIEHDMDVVRAVASHTTVLEDGRVIAQGPTAEVLSDERVIAAYLGRETTSHE